MSILSPRFPFRIERRRALAHGAGLGLAATLGAPAAFATSHGNVTYATGRARYALSKNFTVDNREVHIVPWDVQVFNQSLNLTLQPDGKLLVGTTGLYRMILFCDWVAQQQKDVDLRKSGIRCHRVGSGASAATQIDKGDVRLASADVPGSSMPHAARYAGDWTPGTVGPLQTVMIDVTVSPAGMVLVGDYAHCAHTAITDALLGSAAVNALVMQARVIGADTVRVALRNTDPAAAVTIPAGRLNVLALSATGIAGESSDAYTVLHSPTEELEAGDLVYAVVRSETPGDYLQNTKSTFLQLESAT